MRYIKMSNNEYYDIQYAADRTISKYFGRKEDGSQVS